MNWTCRATCVYVTVPRLLLIWCLKSVNVKFRVEIWNWYKMAPLTHIARHLCFHNGHHATLQGPFFSILPSTLAARGAIYCQLVDNCWIADCVYGDIVRVVNETNEIFFLHVRLSAGFIYGFQYQRHEDNEGFFSLMQITLQPLLYFFLQIPPSSSFRVFSCRLCTLHFGLHVLL